MNYMPIISSSEPLLESGNKLVDLDFSEVFVVVDMQDFFITKNSSVYEHYYLKLRSNIINDIETTLSNNGLVINIKYKDRGDTTESITKLLRTSKSRVLTLSKSTMELVSDYNEYGESLKIESVLREIKNRKTKTKIGGIHASKCVHAVARNFHHEGIDTKVLLGSTLNIHENQEVFNQANMLPGVRSRYGKLSQLIDYGNKAINLPSLTDYL